MGTRQFPKRLAARCAAWALATVAFALAWQALTVHFNYGGNWSALFLTGDFWPVPLGLAKSTYVFPKSKGYDGQFYRYVAHDPAILGDMFQYIDDPAERYRRILVPGIAGLLAAGRGELADGAYIGVTLVFVFLGAWWLAQYAAAKGRNPAWGLLFGLLPATLITIQRMTIDVAVCALCVGFVWYAHNDARWRLFTIAVLATLSRNTGVLVSAACCLRALAQRRWANAVLFATSVVPALLWYRYVAARLEPLMAHSAAVGKAAGVTGVVPPWLVRIPLIGIFKGFRHIRTYPLPPLANQIAQGCDAIAIAGVALAVGLACWQIWRHREETETTLLAAFLAVAAVVSLPLFFRYQRLWADARTAGAAARDASHRQRILVESCAVGHAGLAAEPAIWRRGIGRAEGSFGSFLAAKSPHS